MIKKILSVVILLLFTVKAFAHDEHAGHLGKIHFSTSGSKTAQPYFERGVMWLHSFEYENARENFQKAIALDSNFVMAYWGEAMTYNHPLWSEQDTLAANKVLTKLAINPNDRAKKAQLPIEKDYIKAINLLYGNGNKKKRDRLYAEAMRQLYQKYPDDNEVASFYALSILGTAEGERDFQIYMQAAGIAENIYLHNPQHPGALHYLIHSYDDPIHAPLGLRAACAYAKTAPNASHALHMPSHIFLALGLWDDVITSNKTAWEAGVKQNTSGNPNNFTIDDLHALEWLSYGYLQKKQYNKAYQLTKIMEDITEKTQSPMAKWYYGLMRATYINASQNWNADLKSFNMNHIELSARASDLYINAMIALKKIGTHPDIATANKILIEISHSIVTAIPKKNVGSNYFTSVIAGGIKSAKIICLELKAHIKFALGKKLTSLDLLRQAVEVEKQTSFGYGPPLPIKPSSELYADFLFRAHQYSAAYKQYIFTLKRTPNRLNATQGLSLTTYELKRMKLPAPVGIQLYFNKLMAPTYYY